MIRLELKNVRKSLNGDKKLKAYSTEYFIELANKVHKNKFCYSKTKYVTSHIKVCIICLSHGEFFQKPNNHLMGKGCPSCKQCKLRKKFAMTKEEFINKSISVHGNKYDYSKVIYVNARTKTRIICNIHGEFLQAPYCHYKVKQGCPQCKSNLISEKLTGKKLSQKHRKTLRLARIRKMREQGTNRTFNPKACKFMDNFGKEYGYEFQHGLNGGEVQMLGYFVDGYDKKKKVIFEFDEKRHEFFKEKIKDFERTKNLINSGENLMIRYSEKFNRLYKSFSTYSEIL